tara:strand:- start:1667 stop:3148 length:1482 start_codon:yes stop_codon:yes gene_type:complete
MPLNEPNFDPSYILDFGDTIQLQLTGQQNSIIEIPILRDGSINIPEIGKLFISGLTLDEAADLIDENIDTLLIGVNSFLTLTNVRDIQVIVSGNVYNPGPYILNGNSNLFHALSIAGGPNEQGSYRKVDLIRNGEVIQSIDLYDIFMTGKTSFGTRLRSGDVVFVNPTMTLVSINGAVKRPGTYELLENETGEDIIFFSNGLSRSADEDFVTVEKIINGIATSRRLENFNKLMSVKFDDGDKLFIRDLALRTVTISGAVRNPGTFELNEGDGILELISRSGGYRKNAYPFGGILLNNSALEVAEFAREELYRSFLSSIADNAALLNQSDAITSISFLLSELKNTPVSGRVNAEFNIEKILDDKNLNTILKDGDSILIPEKIDHIYVFGEVSNQGSVAYSKQNSIDDYISLKGGFSDMADKTSIFLVHPNGVSEKLDRKNVFRDGISRANIYPGTIIFIPKKNNNLFRAQSIQAYATILGNLGVSLASVAVLKD